MILFTLNALYFIYRQYMEPLHHIMLGHIHLIVIIRSFTRPLDPSTPRPLDSLNPDHQSTNLEMIHISSLPCHSHKRIDNHPGQPGNILC
jgi:hypothetical protein